MKSTPPARWWTWIRACPSRSGSWTWAACSKRGWGRKVKPEQVDSLPFQAFWKGLTAMRWAQAAPAGVKSLSSVFVKGEAEVAQGADPWRDQSYVVLSKNYMNFSIRLGYHLSTVEAYVSDQVNDNYLTFGFRGGGSTPERRERRARLIEAIIDHLHLNHRRKGELIEARLVQVPRRADGPAPHPAGQTHPLHQTTGHGAVFG